MGMPGVGEEVKMQEIEYEDGIKTKKKFESVLEAIIDAEEKAVKKSIKRLKITRIIPSKKRKRRGGCPLSFEDE